LAVLEVELRKSAQDCEIDDGEDPESYERAEDETRPTPCFLLLVEGPHTKETIGDAING